MKFNTSIAKSESSKIYVHGMDLVDDVIGKISLVDMAFIGATGEQPNAQESKMLEAMMVTVCEHGFTPSSISTRMTYLGAPESIQASMAAGLLGSGEVYLGASEQVAKLLSEYLERYPKKDNQSIAKIIVGEYQDSERILPGFGHPIHKPYDPRTKKIFKVAYELGISSENVELIKYVNEELSKSKGKEITLNVLGAMGAIYNDMGIDHHLIRAFSVAARAVGLISHIREEVELGRKNSVGQQLYNYVEENTVYKDKE